MLLTLKFEERNENMKCPPHYYQKDVSKTLASNMFRNQLRAASYSKEMNIPVGVTIFLSNLN